MALGRNSIFRVGLNSNQVVDALLNDGWRFLETAGSNPAPTNPLPQRTEIIDYVFDNSWAVAANAARQTNQINSVNAAFAAWENVANIDFRQGPNWTSANFAANAEIVLHYVPEASIGWFGGYSGTAGEAQQVTIATPRGVNVQVAENGRVHTYIANDSLMRGNAANPERILDTTTGVATPGGAMLMIHEIGHALGLKHPHDDGADGNPDLTDTNIFLPGVTEDTGVNDTGAAANSGIGLNLTINTIMSYNNAMTTLAGPINSIAAVTSPMALDIAAIQHLYGANRNSHVGNDTYVLTDTSWRCIWDVKGTDEIVYNGTVDAVIDLNPATLNNTTTGGGVPSYLKSTTTAAPIGATNWATGGFTIAGDITNAIADEKGVAGVIIENARGGSGNDEITGNNTDNKLYGNKGTDTLKGMSGNDWLDGGEGADRLEGGAGDDTYIVDEGDVVFELRQISINGSNVGGVDTVRALLGTYTLTDRVENLIYIGTANFTGTGNELGNTIEGLGGADTLRGLAGIDTLRGGNGVDTLYGGSEDDTLYGGDDASLDWLDGGTGGDIMRGGNGGDVYVVDDARDQIIELANQGINDRILTTMQEIQKLAANVEELIFIGDEKATFRATGNELKNNITSRDGNDVLDGGANDDILTSWSNLNNGVGSGNDTLIGGLGKDTMTSGDGFDVFKFAKGWGQDIITDFEHRFDILDMTGVAGLSSISQLLIKTSNEGALIKFGTDSILLRGVAADDLNASDFLFSPSTKVVAGKTLIGKSGNDTLNGTNGNDYIDGGDGMDTLVGGAGADELHGGRGIDFLHVDADDTVVDGGDDFDYVYLDSSKPYGATFKVFNTNVEYVGGTLADDTIDATGVTTAVSMMGNYGDDVLIGGSGHDTLQGTVGKDRLEGGAGNDQLYGGTEADTFVFRIGAGGQDRIMDFNRSQGDIIDFSDHSGVNSLANLAIASDASGNAVLSYVDGQITLVGIAPTAVQQDFFHF